MSSADSKNKAYSDLKYILQIRHGDRSLIYDLNNSTIQWKWSGDANWSCGFVELFKQIFNTPRMDAVATLANLLSYSYDNFFSVHNVIHAAMDNPSSYVKNMLPVNQSAIDSNPHATIIFCQDMRTAFALHKIFGGSQDVIVTGHYGSDLSCLAWNFFGERNVILIVGASADCYVNVEAYKKCLSTANVSSFKVYPHLLLPYGKSLTPNADLGILSETERGLAQNLFFLQNVTNAYLLKKRIEEFSLTFKEFKSWGIEIGLFQSKKNEATVVNEFNDSPLFQVDPTRIDDEAEEITLDCLFFKEGVSLIHGRKNAGKSNVVFEVIRSLTTAEKCLGFFPNRKIVKVLLIDTETPPNRLNKRSQQFGLDTDNINVFIISKLAAPIDSEWSKLDITCAEHQEMILKFALEHQIEYIVIDNLTSAIKAGAPYVQKNAGLIFDWSENLRRQGIGLLIIHHTLNEKNKSSIDGNARGSNEYSIRSHTEIIIIGREEIVRQKEKYPSVVHDFAMLPGATLGLYFKACKMAHSMEQTILWVHIHANKWHVIAHTDTEGTPINELESFYTQADEFFQEMTDQENVVDVDYYVVDEKVDTYDISLPALKHSDDLPSLTEEEHKVYKLCKESQKIKCPDVKKLLGCQNTTAQTILHSLIDKGYIQRYGQGKATYYTVAPNSI